MRQLLNSKTHVLIVGAGPTGLTMAHELLRRGIACRLIEQKDTLAQTSRAIGIHSRTLEIFETMGVVEAFLSQGVQITGGNVYEGGKTLLHLDFQHLDAPYPYILSLPQSKTEQNLLARLRSLRGEVEFSRQLLALQQENDTVVVQVKHTYDDSVEEIQADWVIGCDGARSQVRESLNLKFEGSTYEEEFVQADVNLDWKKSRHEIHVWLHEFGPFAVFPLPDGEQWRLIAGIVDSGRAAPEASVEVLQRIFQERTGDNQTAISNPNWLSNFKIHRRIVNHYRQGRIFLAGDAAHIHSPVGAQGMNTGIQDAYNLAWKLAMVVTGDSSPSLLDTYETERHPIAQSVLTGTHASTQFVTTQNPAIRLIRDQLLTQLLNLGMIRTFMLKRIAELDIHYHNSPLSQNHYGSLAKSTLLPDRTQETPSLQDRISFHAAPKAGDRAPQGFGLHYPSYRQISLFEAFRGTQFNLLLFDGLAQTAEGYTRLLELANQIESSLGTQVRSHLIVAALEPPSALNWSALNWHGSLILDPQQDLHQQYGAAAESLYLIRPDGYIGFRSQSLEAEPLLHYWRNSFQSNTPIHA